MLLSLCVKTGDDAEECRPLHREYKAIARSSGSADQESQLLGLYFSRGEMNKGSNFRELGSFVPYLV